MILVVIKATENTVSCKTSSVLSHEYMCLSTSLSASRSVYRVVEMGLHAIERDYKLVSSRS